MPYNFDLSTQKDQDGQNIEPCRNKTVASILGKGIT